MNNFQISNCDTDSVSFCKPDGSFISKEERISIVKEINDLSPEFMIWADDGFYSKVIILAAKNYILVDEKGKITYKGSSLKDQKKEPALLEFLRKIIDEIINETFNYNEVYNTYVKEILNVQDIKRWCVKRTITSKVLKGTRKNETKVIDAIAGSEYVEGDRVFVYFDQNSNLKLVENYNNDHNIEKLLEKLFKTSKTFENIIPEGTFINYKLKKNKDLLKDL